MPEDPEDCARALRNLRRARQDYVREMKKAGDVAKYAADVLAKLGDQMAMAVAARLVEELEWELRLHDLGIDFTLLRIFDS
jgi:hypothetical protein